ncbi:MAG: radical SAM protein [Clostridia bacterium]|nr:radical SAM protein [Clostridia bacterium]
MKEHVNIPVFIPHLGCPNLCVFCNQRYISGCERFDPSGVRSLIDTALSTVREGQKAQIAFFGGSFTGIGTELMTSLLDTAQSFISEGRADSIRLSTRPDYISEEILTVLSRYSVRTVELGIQSMSDKVLLSSKRGHTADDSESAAALIKDFGFEFVSQLMIGLPSSSPEDEIMSAKKCCEMGADAARIYPTVVFRDSELCDMTVRGEYEPLTLEQAVERTRNVYGIFCENGVPCIRIGLCSSDGVSSDDKYYAGPNHPAIREMVENSMYFDSISKALSGKYGSGPFTGRDLKVTVPARCMSKAVGHKRENAERLRAVYGFRTVIFNESPSLSGYDVTAELSPVFSDSNDRDHH